MADDESASAEAEVEDESLLDRLRGMPVGVEDPTIVGDVGPGDVPPGPDPTGQAGQTEAPTTDPAAP